MNVGDRVKLSQAYINTQEFMHEHLKKNPHHNCVRKTEHDDREGTVIKVTWDDEIVVLWDGCRVADPKNHQYAEMDLTVTVNSLARRKERLTSAARTRSNTRCRDFHIQ